ncbi:hypothetical protein [Streptacidiphilus cavernicola]|uniref:Uncharacterized protein n=1 Tax=Streptacidiphilus cavernicola TaxID=3342716 RepID=A0ABV6VS41_9ACTN
MADTATASTLTLPVDDALLVRLHGTACITCGTTTGPLYGAGHVYTAVAAGQDGCLGWAVVACPEHLAAA